MSSNSKFYFVMTCIFTVLTSAFLLFGIADAYTIVDFESYLNGVKNTHFVLEESIYNEYHNLLTGKITPQKYFVIADDASSQTTSQMSEIISSNPPKEWQVSYSNYMDALKKFNSYILETKHLANLMENDGTQKQMDETTQRIELSKTEYQEYLKISEESRPLGYIPPKTMPFDELPISEKREIVINSAISKFNDQTLRFLLTEMEVSEEDAWEFVGEEKRQRYEQTFEELKNRGILFNSVDGIQLSQLSEYEKIVVLDAMKESTNLLKYRSAELLFKMDGLKNDIENDIQSTTLPQIEKDSIMKDFEFATNSKKTEVMNTVGNQIMAMPYSVLIQESPQKIASDINLYYNDIKRGKSYSPESIIESKHTSSGGGCLIATATYGSELAPQVQQLRELRDNSLLQTESGSAFMSGFNQFYYSFSPIIADWERENPIFKEAVKITLTPMITSLSILNYVDIDSEVSVLGYGISLIILNLGMYFVAPAIVIVGIRKRF